jgi:hypothetical protein
MDSGVRWKLVSGGIALLSLAVFAFFVYSGSTLTPTQCGTVPCSLHSILRAATNNVNALSDYVYGVTALLIGQLALASIWVVRRLRAPRPD